MSASASALARFEQPVYLRLTDPLSHYIWYEVYGTTLTQPHLIVVMTTEIWNREVHYPASIRRLRALRCYLDHPYSCHIDHKMSNIAIVSIERRSSNYLKGNGACEALRLITAPIEHLSRPADQGDMKQKVAFNDFQSFMTEHELPEKLY
jgi:hypothetical protein